jgi:hypothetical protein
MTLLLAGEAQSESQRSLTNDSQLKSNCRRSASALPDAREGGTITSKTLSHEESDGGKVFKGSGIAVYEIRGKDTRRCEASG